MVNPSPISLNFSEPLPSLMSLNFLETKTTFFFTASLTANQGLLCRQAGGGGGGGRFTCLKCGYLQIGDSLCGCDQNLYTLQVQLKLTTAELCFATPPHPTCNIDSIYRIYSIRSRGFYSLAANFRPGVYMRPGL